MTASEEDLEIYKRIAENYESKRYTVFGGHKFCSNGGWEDHIADCKSIEACKEELLTCLHTGGLDWWHIVDMKKGEIVESGP